MDSLAQRLTQKGFRPKHVAEVGVYRPETSAVREWVLKGVRATLVEPMPETVELIQKEWGSLETVTLHPVAVSHSPGSVELVRRDASTFVSSLELPPAVVNGGYTPQEKDKLVVPAITFDQIDDGSIDLLSLDTEGCEWFVLQKMVSRPVVIAL